MAKLNKNINETELTKMKIIINRIYKLNTKLLIKSVQKPEVSKIIVIYENEHDKNWSKMSKIRHF